MDYITAQTPDKGVQIGPEPPISNDSIALTPDKGVQIGKELPIINASIALTPDKGVQIGPEPPIINASIAMEPDKGVQIGPEPSISNDSIAMTSDTVPGFAGNLIEVGIVINGSKSAVYQSTAYPANADRSQRPGAVAEYSSEFSVGEGFSVGGAKSELPAGYIVADFLKSSFAQAITVPSVQFDYNDTIRWVQSQLTDRETSGIFSSLNSYETCRMFIGGGNIQLSIWGRTLKLRGFINNGRYVQIDKNGVTVDGSLMSFSSPATSGSREGLVIFAEFNPPAWPCEIAFHEFEVVDKVKLKPALDEHGTPCMFDLLQKQPHYNVKTTPFIVGFTLSQALNLRNLPTTGGTLTISLPEGYDSNAGVMAALETARLKGWTLTIQTYTPETAAEGASTFALRRIWVRKTQNEQGGYVDADEKRWQVDWCVDMLTPDGSTPDAYGYEMFRNVDAAVAYWELTPYVDPETEEEFSQEL